MIQKNQKLYNLQGSQRYPLRKAGIPNEPPLSHDERKKVSESIKEEISDVARTLLYIILVFLSATGISHNNLKELKANSAKYILDHFKK